MPRLVMMVRYGMDLPVEVIEAQVLSALDLIVQQDRMPDGSRRITAVVGRGDFGFVPIVTWDDRARAYRWSDLPKWLDDLQRYGVAGEEVRRWHQSVRCSS